MAKDQKSSDDETGTGLGGLLHSLGGFLDMVDSRLADKDEQELHRSGELGHDAKGTKAVYGFSVRVGGGGKPKIEPFGNVIKKGARSPAVDDEREPMVDVFDEESHVLVVAELPGVEERDIHYKLNMAVLSLSARRGDHRYAKEIRLPAAVTTDGATLAYRNGVCELKLRKEAP